MLLVGVCGIALHEELPGLVEDSNDDDDVHEELPDMVEDSSDDDDVYEELNIKTQTEPERLALVRAVRHSTPELTYIIDLDRTGGKEGRAKQGLFLFAGMLSVLFTNLIDGTCHRWALSMDYVVRVLE
eukprot:jgi/Tetstr1/440776/TSEL_029084.t1